MTVPAAVSASRNEVRTVAPRLIEPTSAAKVVKQVFEEAKA
jgi:hypothetical protein